MPAVMCVHGPGHCGAGWMRGGSRGKDSEHWSASTTQEVKTSWFNGVGCDTRSTQKVQIYQESSNNRVVLRTRVPGARYCIQQELNLVVHEMECVGGPAHTDAHREVSSY
jgi:hypothetical protein